MNNGRSASSTIAALSSALADNLRRHASRFESISALCRACEINRQQFNKYLNGETLPSLINIVKMAEVLGVEVDDLITPVRARTRGLRGPAALHADLGGPDRLRITPGYYLDYGASSVFRDMLIVSLCQIGRRNGGFFVKAKLLNKSYHANNRRFFNYHGSAFSSRDAIYFTYLSERDPADLIHCAAQPDVRHSADLVGVRNGMSNSSPPIPFGAAFYLSYLGDRPNLREAMRQCGVFRLDGLDERQRRIYDRLEAKTQTAPNILRIAYT